MQISRTSMGLAVRAVRDAAKLSAADLSQVVGMTPSSLSRTENGLRSLEFVEAVAIAEAVGLDINKLLSLAQTYESSGTGERRSSLKKDMNDLERLALQAAVEANSEFSN